MNPRPKTGFRDFPISFGKMRHKTVSASKRQSEFESISEERRHRPHTSPLSYHLGVDDYSSLLDELDCYDEDLSDK